MPPLHSTIYSRDDDGCAPAFSKALGASRALLVQRLLRQQDAAGSERKGVPMRPASLAPSLYRARHVPDRHDLDERRAGPPLIAGAIQHPTAHPLNRTAIIGLQRTLGNHHVQRLLQSPPASALQRCGAIPCACSHEERSRHALARPPAATAGAAAKPAARQAALARWLADPAHGQALMRRLADPGQGAILGQRLVEAHQGATPQIQRWWDDEEGTAIEGAGPSALDWTSDATGGAAVWAGEQADGAAGWYDGQASGAVDTAAGGAQGAGWAQGQGGAGSGWASVPEVGAGAGGSEMPEGYASEAVPWFPDRAPDEGFGDCFKKNLAAAGFAGLGGYASVLASTCGITLKAGTPGAIACLAAALGIPIAAAAYIVYNCSSPPDEEVPATKTKPVPKTPLVPDADEPSIDDPVPVPSGGQQPARSSPWFDEPDFEP
jgi:hypothetical protein